MPEHLQVVPLPERDKAPPAGEPHRRSRSSVSPSFTIARIAGIRIGVNWSWLIVFAPVIADDRVVGLLPFAAVARVPRSDWETTRVGSCMLPLEEMVAVREDEALLDAIGHPRERTLDRALVFDGDHPIDVAQAVVSRLLLQASLGRRPLRTVALTRRQPRRPRWGEAPGARLGAGRLKRLAQRLIAQA